MSAHDVPMKPVLATAFTIMLVVAIVIAVVFALLHFWHASAGGTPLHGAEGAAAMARAGPALQSAPQIEGATYRADKARELAASESGR